MGRIDYGIEAPRGVRKAWEANSMTTDSTGDYLRSKGVPADWGDPIKAVAWFAASGQLRACVGHYSNDRQAVLKQLTRCWTLELMPLPPSPTQEA